MNIIKAVVRFSLALGLGFCLAWPFLRTSKADFNPSLPSIVHTGLAVYASGGPDAAVLAWRKGGPLEGDKKAAEQADDFRQMEKSLGHYKSFELIETHEIGKTSKLVYLSMNFERGAIYARFQIFKAAKDWVVQNMEFDTKPEAIMPWLASAAAN